jgi:hypothetical protein
LGPYHKKVRRKDVDLQPPPTGGAAVSQAKRPKKRPQRALSHAELDNVELKLPSNLATDTFKARWREFTLWRTTLGERLQPDEAKELLDHYGAVGEARAIAELKAAMGNGGKQTEFF